VVYADCFTKLIQLVGIASFIVAEIMEMNQDPQFMKRFYTIHHIDRTTVIRRPGHVKTNDMKMSGHLEKYDL